MPRAIATRQPHSPSSLAHAACPPAGRPSRSTAHSIWLTLSSARPSTLVLYHRALALLVCVELTDRWSVTQLLTSAHSVGTRALPPTPLLDGLEWRPVLLLAAAAAGGSLCGSRLARIVLLLLHVTLSLRHPTFVWILDRYAQLLLLVSALLPSQQPSQPPPSRQRQPPPSRQRSQPFLSRERLDKGQPVLSSGVVALARLQVVWIYLDAAAVKLRSGAWWRAAPGRLSALDVYLRHTRGLTLTPTPTRTATPTLTRTLSPNPNPDPSPSPSPSQAHARRGLTLALALALTLTLTPTLTP